MEWTPVPIIEYDGDAIPKRSVVLGEVIEYIIKSTIPLPVDGNRYIVNRIFSTADPSKTIVKGVMRLESGLRTVMRDNIMYTCYTISLRYTFEEIGEFGIEISLSHDEEGENLIVGIGLNDIIKVEHSPSFLEPPVPIPIPDTNPIIITNFYI
ncbi:hypothetical protein GX50_02987 [[Emmonsia] crescens]|uniref:Uncharacterized protein n=1 Tax=[Emmonsia] crescens TaxID=73230 RepID=A0A2B7ZM16_9EURO|nr:hypothetical protein GX50_02987 [Emmonsia crescens]